MIISTKSPSFIFVQAPKCAAKSITQALRPFSTHEPGNHLSPNEFLNGNYAEFDSKTAKETWNTAVTAMVVRNPYDRELSNYCYIRNTGQHPRYEMVKEMSFEQYIRWRASNPFTQSQFVSVGGGLPKFDHVMKFESLGEDFKRFSEHLELDLSLPHINKTNHRDWREVYTEELKELIRGAYWQDFATFGYDE